MMNQVNSLRSKGLNVCYLNSSVEQRDWDTVIHHMLSSTLEYNFVFPTHEIAVTACMLDVFLKIKCNGAISCTVIDECHCIDMWGFDFQPA